MGDGCYFQMTAAKGDVEKINEVIFNGDSDCWDEVIDNEAPFATLTEAEEFQEALKTCKYAYKRIPTEYCEAVTPDIDAARSTAIWPEATLEQLQSKEDLLHRLPGLMKDFRGDIEKLGLIF